MPILNRYFRERKISYFTQDIPKEAKILEIGCADGWLGRYFRAAGYKNYIGMDVLAPADIVGDIKDWQELGLKRESFDVVIAFEVIEHVNCFKDIYDILKPQGILMLTSPLPHMDWFCLLLEKIGLLQKRDSPHSNLTNFKDILFFRPLEIRRIWFLAQWGKFIKPANNN